MSDYSDSGNRDTRDISTDISDASKDVNNNGSSEIPAEISEDVAVADTDNIASEASHENRVDIPEDIPAEAMVEPRRTTTDEIQEDVQDDQRQEKPAIREHELTRQNVGGADSCGQATCQQLKETQGTTTNEAPPEQHEEPTKQEERPKGDSTRHIETDLYDEIHNGNDIPGKTDYFGDKERAKETLSDFEPSNWEQCALDDKKASIETLADYNADILGIQNKPSISYYDNKDSGDFGGFKPQTNVLSINGHNLGDGPEVADTVSHEYRHAYQSQHSEHPMSDRDIAFRDDIDNPIDPEQDYEGYRDRLVERDAREYAQRFKDYIRG